MADEKETPKTDAAAPAAGSGAAPTPGGAAPATPEPKAPADALTKSNDEVAAEMEANGTPRPKPEPPKKATGFKGFLKRANLYFLIFLLLVIIAAAVTIVSYLNSKKTAPSPTTPSQTLSQDALKALASGDATVGGSAQTLTIQGNTVINGTVLMKSSLGVAGDLSLGGKFLSANLTVSGLSNLNTVQINTLQVAQGATIQGSTTLQTLNVAGTSAFNGAVTAGQITVNKLIFSGNGVLQVPNHLAFTGATPLRKITNSGMLGAGGSSSLNGSDTSGTITINTGNGPSGTGCFISVTFNSKFASTPRVIISPVGAAAGIMQYYVDNRDTNGFNICSANTLSGNATFAFDYFIAD